MNILIPTHHSMADWDFLGSPRGLSPVHFVSPPTSLSLTGGLMAAGACRHPDTQVLAQGRIVAWWRQPRRGYCHMWFRIQAPLGSAWGNDYYYVSFTSGPEIDLGKVVAGVGSGLGNWDFAWPYNTWWQVRITWEILPPINGNKRLTVKFEANTGAGFIDYGDLIDEDADFEDSDINRVGFVIRDTGSFQDDYQIYRKG